MMRPDGVKHTFSHLHVNVKGGDEHAHKPLMLLIMLGRCSRGEERLIRFRDLDERFQALAKKFPLLKMRRDAAMYPFLYLRNDKCVGKPIWEVQNLECVPTKPKGPAGLPSHRAMLKCDDLRGGFSKPLHDLICDDRALQLKLAWTLLRRYIDPQWHKELLLAVGMSPLETATPQDLRNGVLISYRNRCSVCSYSGELDGQLVGLDVTYIQWPGAGGPHQKDNALALCSQHRDLFIRGAFTLEDDLAIDVSDQFREASAFHNLHGMAGNTILKPAHAADRPKTKFLAWHRDNVYRRA